MFILVALLETSITRSFSSFVGNVVASGVTYLHSSGEEREVSKLCNAMRAHGYVVTVNIVFKN